MYPVYTVYCVHSVIWNVGQCLVVQDQMLFRVFSRLKLMIPNKLQFIFLSLSFNKLIHHHLFQKPCFRAEAYSAVSCYVNGNDLLELPPFCIKWETSYLITAMRVNIHKQRDQQTCQEKFCSIKNKASRQRSVKSGYLFLKSIGYSPNLVG